MPREEIDERLTGPGGPFELEEVGVLGERMLVLRNRPRSLRELLSQSAARGDAACHVYGARRTTYAEHARRVASVARALEERFGVRAGDRVAILAANRPEWMETWWAAVSLGAIAVGLNGWWAGPEIRYGLEHCEPRVLVGDRKRLARLGGDPGVPVVEMEADFESLASHDPGAALPKTEIDEDDPGCMLYTSGTTGRPKGAVHSHRNIGALAGVQTLHGLAMMLRAAAAGAAPKDPPIPPCSLVTTPLFHVSGLYSGAVVMLAVGAKVVFRDGAFDAGDVMRLIERERVTTWTAMGTMAHRLLGHPDFGAYDLSSLGNIGSGGAPLHPALQERLRAAFPRGGRNLAFGYGLTESTGIVSIASGEQLLEHPHSAGTAAPTVKIEIRDEAGRVLPDGEEGEIHVRSPLVMLGYWRDPEATAEAILPGRWLRTGDVGRLEEGLLFVNARARDLILRGGENVSPVEIEQRLEAHPAVAEAAVLGVEHEELGQEVQAVVALEAGAEVDACELARFVGEALAAYKVPTRWEIRRAPLPRNAAGKVLKRALLEEPDSPLVED